MKKQISFLAIAFVGCTLLMTSCKKPAASFTSDKTTAKVGEAVNFTNTSTGASQLMWDFGDGTQSTSTQMTMSHVYLRTGDYIVSLMAAKKNGKKPSDAPTITITVTGAPTANFTASKTSPAAGEVVTFTSTSVGAEEFDWDFGDGSVPLVHNPIQSHTFTTGGSYTVTLTTYAVNHTLLSSKSIVITVGGASGNNVNLGMIIGNWKYASKTVTDKRNGVIFTSNNAGSPGSPNTNYLYTQGTGVPVTSTDMHEFTTNGLIIKTDINGNYLTNGSFSLLDGTRMVYSGQGSLAYSMYTAIPYATYVVTATTLTITYVSTCQTLPTYTDFTANVVHSNEKQVITTVFNYTK